MKKIMKGIYWSVELTSKVRGSRRGGYSEGIIILNNGRPVVVEYEVEVEVEEISSTTTTTTKKVIEKTKMYNTKLKLVRRRSKKKEGKSFLVN